MKNKITLLILAVVVSVLGFSQKNATKIRYSPVPAINMGFDYNIGPVMKLFSGVISLSQERALNDRISLQATFRYLPNKTGGILDSITTVEYDAEDYNPWGEPSFSGMGAFLDLRIYGEGSALSGFYWGPYLHTMTYKLESERDYLEALDDNGVLYYGEAQTRYKMSNLGVGLQIGTQKKFDNGLILDWTILGIGINGVKVIGEIDVEKSSGNFDFRNYEDELNSDATSFIVDNPKIDVEKESVRISSDRYFSMKNLTGDLYPFLNFRMGLSIGFGYGN